MNSSGVGKLRYACRTWHARLFSLTRSSLNFFSCKTHQNQHQTLHAIMTFIITKHINIAHVNCKKMVKQYLIFPITEKPLHWNLLLSLATSALKYLSKNFYIHRPLFSYLIIPDKFDLTTTWLEFFKLKNTNDFKMQQA